MKLILVNQRYGHTRTIVIRGWLKGLLSLCLLGAPVALGLGYHLAVAEESTQLVASHEHGAADTVDEVTAALERVGQREASEPALILRSLSQTAQDGSVPPALAAAPAVALAQVAHIHVGVYPAPQQDIFPHGRVIDPASYLQRTHR